jgi:hypothetical protein
VVLALRVVTVQPGDPAAQRGSTAGEDAGVDQVHRALGVVGILFLDHRLNPILLVAQHTAVTERIGQSRGEQRQAVGRDQWAQGFRTGQRHVAIEHQHARIVRHVDQCLRDRVASAESLGLPYPLQIAVRTERFAHLLAAVAVDHVDRRRREFACRRQHVAEQRLPGHRHEDLGALGLHALAFAGGEDDDMQGGCFHGTPG